MNRNRQAGEHWEQAAESFLHARGLRTVKRNYNCRWGEIDLIMEDGDCLVFAEIRYRANPGFGTGAESVTRSKQNRIIRAAQRYLQYHGCRGMRPCRFDVVSMSHEGGKLCVRWIRDAFTAS